MKQKIRVNPKMLLLAGLITLAVCYFVFMPVHAAYQGNVSAYNETSLDQIELSSSLQYNDDIGNISMSQVDNITTGTIDFQMPVSVHVEGIDLLIDLLTVIAYAIVTIMFVVVILFIKLVADWVTARRKL